ncbi:MAG TPA: hypothetical protein VHZ24_11095 [Pirellulales bacterium]|nr:hypothetical protein [Pirellulales bacterium]
MIKFSVDGPYEIEPIHEVGGKLIEKSAVERFWADESKAHISEAVGCYVFGFRAGKGMVPAYVGQSKTGFRNECFDHHKLTHYNTALVKKKKGTPVMFFVYKTEGSKHEFEACIDRVEYLLIQYALTRNHELSNVHVADWCIQGVYRGSRGKPSESALLFRKMLGIGYEADEAEDEEIAADGVPQAPMSDIHSLGQGDPLPPAQSTTTKPSPVPAQ